MLKGRLGEAAQAEVAFGAFWSYKVHLLVSPTMCAPFGFY